MRVHFKNSAVFNRPTTSIFPRFFYFSHNRMMATQFLTTDEGRVFPYKLHIMLLATEYHLHLRNVNPL